MKCVGKDDPLASKHAKLAYSTADPACRSACSPAGQTLVQMRLLFTTAAPGGSCPVAHPSQTLMLYSQGCN